MNQYRDADLDRQLGDWLREETTTRAPGRLVEEVFARTSRSPQAGRWWPIWPIRSRDDEMRPDILGRSGFGGRWLGGLVQVAGFAGFAAVVVVLVGLVVWPRATTPGASAGPSSSPSESPPTPIPLNGQVNPSGRYLVGNGLASRVTVDVPSGWSASGDYGLLGPTGDQPPDGMAIRFYTVQNLFKNPLAINEGVLDPPVGPTVADLVAAIVSDHAWTASEPTDITIDGLAGKLVTITIPTDANLGIKNFYLFAHASGVPVPGSALGQTFDLHIVNVGGERIVIDAFHFPGTPASDLAAQQAVLDSIQLDPAP